MNDVFSQMLAAHAMQGVDGQRNALYEVMQQVTLAGLARGGFFHEAGSMEVLVCDYSMD